MFTVLNGAVELRMRKSKKMLAFPNVRCYNVKRMVSKGFLRLFFDALLRDREQEMPCFPGL